MAKKTYTVKYKGEVYSVRASSLPTRETMKKNFSKLKGKEISSKKKLSPIIAMLEEKRKELATPKNLIKNLLMPGRGILQGLGLGGQLFGGVSRALAEPEKETGTLPQMYEKAFMRGFKDPSQAIGVGGKEFVEQYNLPPWAAGTLGTAYDLALGETLFGFAGRGTKVDPSLVSPRGRAVKPFMTEHPFGLIRARQFQEAGVSVNPVEKITRAVQAARPVRAKQEALYTAERTRRAGKITAIGKKLPGEAGYRAQLGALKGELGRVQFEGVRNKVTQPDIDSLFNIVEQNPSLLPYEKITTKTGLTKLLDGSVPTKGELSLLAEVFPQEFIRTISSKMPFLQKTKQSIGQLANFPRAMMAGVDLSAIFRQGLFLIRYPKQFLFAKANQYRYAFSEKAYEGLMANIRNRPNYPLYRQGKLALTDLGASLTSREEAIMSNLPEKIPILGRAYRASNRAYTGFLNRLRVDVFDNLIAQAKKSSIPLTNKLIDDIGNFVSTASGRGRLPASIERAAVALNALLFSPRLMASRINLMNPLYYARLSPLVRKQAIQALLTLAGTGKLVTGLAKMGGADVETNPRNPDFEKIKVGNTRYDIWGGFQQYYRFLSQIITGEMISSTTGVKKTLGEGYKATTRWDVLQNFVGGKLAPLPSFVVTLLKGKGMFGKELDVPKEVGIRFVPMVIQDFYDIYKERGAKYLAMALPAVFGVGVQTYGADASEMVHSANSVKKNFRELMKQGKMEEATKLYSKNVEVIRIGEALEPLQKNINILKRMIKTIEKNVLIDPIRKKLLKTTYDRKMKELETQLENQYKVLKQR